MAEELNEVETPIENIDSTNDEEVVEDNTETDSTPTLEDYEVLKQKNRELYERAKKAEALAKAKRDAELKSNKTNETQTGLSREEAILYAKGYTDDEVELANKLAKVNGTNPLVAIEDEIFKAKVSARLKKEKSEKASLGASNSSSQFKSAKPYKEMTEEERVAQFNKAMGNV